MVDVENAQNSENSKNAINIRKVLVVNGPNLGRLGVRQPDVYGSQDFKTLCALCKKWAQELNLQVEVRQSYALADAAHIVLDAGVPLMEVHISNPSARDSFRKISVISPVATGTITGMGLYGYKLALEAVAHLI